ncbi:mechanosensitive ion channel family protein [Polymorphobacter fuscus]|uniref:Small-conductance mechanosensitive channel n=1 Tax=Sandarakinorhabdus fusca TaxID=1439888 RepID=A0A7C9GND9_9SPHN|nr:mechanosensitive ion channel family protein [Polymorphobacter fuscus]KAB7647426.1 mechanosensitive ion channel family protein [Polymorphobacter fuscus]MQT16675.1 mechanosensitive ion channel [Polymorphobacter fuscus]NJC09340.1 small conductance mechanosensitive channel [Polymorphobacter fuscus]
METTVSEVSIWSATVLPFITAIGLKIVGAIVLYMVGRWLISFAVNVMSRVLTARNFDPTLQRYLANILGVVLNIVLVVAILGYFGMQTTSFAALLAGVGLAVGAAWSGLLGNFAAGAFLIIFRPYKVGDYVIAAGIEGTVTEIGLFNTVITSPDNVQTIVGNGKVSSDTIKNFSTHSYRRVDRTAQLAFGVDPLDAIARLKPALAGIANVMADPAPDVEIIDFNERGTVLAVRPYCHTRDYWQVTFDTNRLIAATFGAAGFPPPFTVERDQLVILDHDLDAIAEAVNKTRPAAPPPAST